MPKPILASIAGALALASALTWFMAGKESTTSAPPRMTPQPSISSAVPTLPKLDTREGVAPKPTTTTLEHKIIGTLSVPAAQIVGLGITRGIDDSTLDTGLAGAYEWSGPGETGVFAMAGHRIGAGGPFRYLNQIHVGDSITVRSERHEYTYRTTRVQEVSPTDVSVLNGSADKSEIVLITCTPIPAFTKRLVVTGELVPLKR